MTWQDWYCVECARAGVEQIDTRDAFGTARKLRKAHSKPFYLTDQNGTVGPAICYFDARVGATYENKPI